MILMKSGFIFSGILLVLAFVQGIVMKSRLTKKSYLLDCVSEAGRRERERIAAENRQRAFEAEKQAKRVFGLDVLITHGTAFGGFAGTCPDGKSRRGFVPLDQIMMYGRQPSGKEYTYYIEDQGILFCAGEDADSLIIKSEEPFEIRQAGLGRDQGYTTVTAAIKKNILYYIILESHHEISVKATARC